MEAEAFARWLDEMKARFRDVGTDADCARMLGVHKNTVSNMRERGATHTVALACRALLHRLEPYG